MTETKSLDQTVDAPPAVRKRRSQRIHIAIPVTVRVKSGNLFLEETTTTVRVNAHGCLVYLAAQLKRGQLITLVNPATQEQVACTVSFLGKADTEKDGEKIEVGLEFNDPSPLFWRIHFPPEDWNPEDRKLPPGVTAPPVSGSTHKS